MDHFKMDPQSLKHGAVTLQCFVSPNEECPVAGSAGVETESNNTVCQKPHSARFKGTLHFENASQVEYQAFPRTKQYTQTHV